MIQKCPDKALYVVISDGVSSVKEQIGQHVFHWCVVFVLCCVCQLVWGQQLWLAIACLQDKDFDITTRLDCLLMTLVLCNYAVECSKEKKKE